MPNAIPIVGDIGPQAKETSSMLQWFPNTPGSNTFSLTGGVVTLNIKRPDGTELDGLVCAIEPDGLSAIYVIRNTDFPVGGVYRLVFVGALVSGQVLRSPIIKLPVGDTIG